MLLNPERTEFDLFVGSRIGSFKHIKYHTDQTKNSKKCIENLQEISSLQKDDTITCLRWATADQEEVLVGRASQQVQVYDTAAAQFTSSFVADHGEGHVVGVARLRRRLVTALSGGAVRVWRAGGAAAADLHAGGAIDRMRGCDDDDTFFATGGKENDVKVWRLGEASPVFAAKNVRNDWLELRAPLWPTDLCFLPGGGGALLAACSRYGTVRLYDTRVQRRPVCEVQFTNMAATCIAPGFSEREVLVGFGRGQLHAVDMRGKGRPDKGYKGSVGAVTEVATVPGAPYLVSTSLDRHLKVHHATSKELLYKQYLTSKLSCVLVQTARATPLRRAKTEPAAGGEEEAAAADAGEGSDVELDEIFEVMDAVREETPKRAKRKPQRPAGKRPRGEARGEEEAAEAEGVEDGIAKLLRLTERKKRRMEKVKRQKKAKSVFNDA